jgi:folate-binding protein YgfZ
METVKHTAFTTLLPHRSVIRIGGEDRLGFLQGLISNDVSKASATHAIYAALLTPQGKFLHDLFILDHDSAYLIDCEATRAEDLISRLSAYKLRSKVTFENLADKFDVWAVWEDTLGPDAPHKAVIPQNFLFHAAERRGKTNLCGTQSDSPQTPAASIQSPAEHLAFPDPRLPERGLRAFVPKGEAPENVQPTDLAAYDSHRLSLGIADGSRDLEIEKSTLAEGNFDLLNGIDWKKGCYVGQELTARMHYRGLAKKRLFPVRIEGESPPYGATLSNDSGEMRSSCGKQGLALLKIDAVRQALDQETPLTHGNAKIWPSFPAWMKIDVQPANS